VEKTPEVSCNILGPTGLGFRHRDDVTEVVRMLEDMGVVVNLVAPMGSSPRDLEQLGAAHFNVMLYPEIAEEACRWLEKTYHQPYTKTVPIGVGATRDFLAEVADLAGPLCGYISACACSGLPRALLPPDGLGGGQCDF